MNIIAKKSRWEILPIDSPKKIAINMRFSEKQFLKLIKGLIPREMEDKWFIYCEDNWIYFHRSWTGYGIYKAEITAVQDEYYIKEFWAERNLKKYNNTNDYEDKETFTFLISTELLRVNTSEKLCYSDAGTDPKNIWSNFGRLLSTKNKGMDYTDKAKAVLFGVAVGDALGVPVEFQNREELIKNPVTDMIGYGTYNQPPGTFSDDGSLTFCLAEALTQDFDLNTIGQNFINWRDNNYWTARGEVFDIGIATNEAIKRLANGEIPEFAGGRDISSNGNGSLMRIAPLVFYLLDKPIEQRYEITKLVSSITHGHIRSVIACFYYLEFAKQILLGKDKFEIYKDLQKEIPNYLSYISIDSSEIYEFDKLLKNNIDELTADSISSSGYVLDSLEASIWCLLTTNTYEEAVLKAVNLGRDTDTIAAITGGLAGLLYGIENIPKRWIDQMARREDIENLAKRLASKISSN